MATPLHLYFKYIQTFPITYTELDFKHSQIHTHICPIDPYRSHTYQHVVITHIIRAGNVFTVALFPLYPVQLCDSGFIICIYGLQLSKSSPQIHSPQFRCRHLTAFQHHCRSLRFDIMIPHTSTHPFPCHRPPRCTWYPTAFAYRWHCCSTHQHGIYNLGCADRPLVSRELHSSRHRLTSCV